MSYELFDENFKPFDRQKEPIPLDKALEKLMEKGILERQFRVKKIKGKDKMPQL